MKDKSFILFIVMAIAMMVMLSCDPEEYKTAKNDKPNTESFFPLRKSAKMTRIHLNGEGSFYYSAYFVEFDGHEYILVSGTESISFKHLVSCPCHKKVEEVEEPKEVEPDTGFHWDY